MKRTSVEEVVRHSMNLGKDEPLNRKSIEDYQFDRLRQTVAYALEKSSFYRKKLAGIIPSDIRDHQSLSLMPFTTENDLRRNGKNLLCVSQDKVARIVTMQSSGTTGIPKRLFFTEEDLERTIDFFHQGMKTLVDPGQRVQILLPGASPDSTGDLLSRALARMNVSSRVYGLVGEPLKEAEQIFADTSDTLVGFPVQILALSRTAEGRDVPRGCIKTVLLCSDYIPQVVCDELTARWGCRVFSHYGTVETGLGGGVECDGLCGCHLRETDLFFEVISPETGASLVPGEFGEIVFTTLSRTGMPLIRYRTGDYGRLLAGPCVCGSTIMRLDKVRGRIAQRLSLDNGQILSMDILDESLLSIGELLDFQAEIRRENDRDIFGVRLEVMPRCKNRVKKQAGLLLKNMPQLENIPIRLEADSSGLISKGKRIIIDTRGM